MMEALLVSQVLLWIAMAAVVLVMAAMLRQLGVLFERVAPAGALSMNSRLAAGDPAPQFTAPALDGSEVSIGGDAKDSLSTLLFFFSGDCPVCKELMPALKSFESREKQGLRVLYVGSAQETAHNEIARERNIALASYVVSDEIGMAYAVAKLPYAVLIGPDGNIAAFGLVNNREHLESLIEAQERRVASIQEYMKKTA